MQNKGILEKRTSFLHRFLRISLILKGIDGVLELIGGILFLLVHRSTIDRTIAFLTRHELTEDPHDLLANLLTHIAAHLSLKTKIVASVYLLAHGIIKVILVAGLLMDRKGFFPPALIFIGIFILLEAGRLSQSFSIGILLLMLFDILVITLIWLEYRSIQ